MGPEIAHRSFGYPSGLVGCRHVLSGFSERPTQAFRGRGDPSEIDGEKGILIRVVHKNRVRPPPLMSAISHFRSQLRVLEFGWTPPTAAKRTNRRLGNMCLLSPCEARRGRCAPLECFGERRRTPLCVSTLLKIVSPSLGTHARGISFRGVSSLLHDANGRTTTSW